MKAFVAKNQKKVYLSIAAAAVCAATFLPGVASASDGTINITGAVTASTCSIQGAASPVTIAVALPTVSTSALATTGSVAGLTPFNFKLSGCTAALKTATTYFQPGPTVDTTTNNLILQGTGVATSVELQLLNASQAQILLSAASGSQNSQTVTLASGAATMSYFAQYVATGATVGAGSANSSVTFTMVYQ